MGDFQHRIRQFIARLDGRHERRTVALGTMALFLALLFGPWMLRTVDAVANPISLTIQSLGTAPVSGPIILQATGAGAPILGVQFVLTADNGVALTLPAVKTSSVDDPSSWSATFTAGEPGRSYSMIARGAIAGNTAQLIQSDPARFSIAAPPAAGSPADTSVNTAAPVDTSVTRFAEMVSIGLNDAAGNTVTVSGVQSSFEPASAVFHAESGAPFSRDFPATRGTDGLWRASFALPPGDTYQIKLSVLSSDGLQVNSPSRQISVPKAPSPSAPPAPAASPALTILFPAPDAAQVGAVNIAVRVSSATAASVIFEIRDQSGGISNLPAAWSAADGVWSALFSGDPGKYVLSVRASLDNGFVQEFSAMRGFSVLADPQPAASAGTDQPTATGSDALSSTSTPPVVTPPATATTAPVAELSVELLAPQEQAAPFENGVPLTARVKNGLPDRLVFVVNAVTGGETIVLGRDSGDGVWTALFEGADGGYYVRARATAGTSDLFSAPRRFALKKPVLPPAAAANKAAEPPAKEAAPKTPVAPVIPRPVAEAPKAVNESSGAASRDLSATSSGKIASAPDAASQIEQARVEARPFINRTITSDQMPPAVDKLMAITPKPDERWRVMASMVVADATSTSPALMTLDSDGDGLSDDAEKRFGTDPHDPDTDHDGFSDGEEVKNGYNPLGPGPLTQPLRGVDKAMVDGAPLQEPRGASYKTDADFSLKVAAGKSATATPDISLSGKAAPNSVVTLFIYSFLPVVVTTTTDVDGNWNYDFSSRLNDGRHEAYVSVNDDTGKLVAASNPIGFFVKDAQAVSAADFLRADVNVVAPVDSGMNWFMIGGGALIVLALALVGLIIAQTRGSREAIGTEDQEKRL